MAKRSRVRLTLGGALIALSAALRILQLLLGFFRSTLGSTVPFSAVTLCCFVGGLCIFAYEHRRTAAWLAFATAVCALADTFLLGVEGLRIPALLFYFLTFALYGLTLLSLRGSRRKWIGAAILLLAVVLTLPAAGMLSLPAGALLCLLTLEWLCIGAGACL